jgi:adenylate cyclase
MNRTKRRSRLAPLLAGLAALLAVLAMRAWDPAPLRQARLAGFDTLQRAATRLYQPLPVKVVLIDDDSLARVGQWPWPRDLLARMLTRLADRGAATVVLDTVFAEPDRLSPARLALAWREAGIVPQGALNPAELPDNDWVLAQTLRTVRVVTGFALTAQPNDARPARKTGFAFASTIGFDEVPDFAGAVVNLPQLREAATGNGSFSIVARDDRVIRRLPLLARLNGEFYPSLVLEALRVAQGTDAIAVRHFDDGRGMAIKVGRYVVPTEDDGSIWLRYAAAAPGRAIPAWQILADDETVDSAVVDVNGAIVLVGFSAAGLSDLRATPLNPFEPGVNVHAQGLEQILLGDWLRRGDWSLGIEIVFALLLAAIVIAALGLAGIRWSLIATGLGLASTVGAVWVAYTGHGLLFDVSFPALATVASFLAVASVAYFHTERDKRFIRDAFAQYLSPDLVDQLAADPGELKLGGDARELTFLFTDLAGFTSYAEGVDPETLVRTLNEYLEGVCEIVMAHDGTVDKIVGDAVHGMFNAPLALPDHAARALAAALAIEDFSNDFARRMAATGRPFGLTRIGLNTGTAIVGNFGGRRRFDYTAHGDAINTAARLEGANKYLGTRICVAASTAAQCPGAAFRPVGTLMVQGKSEGIEVFEPLRGGDDATRYRLAFQALAGGSAEEAAGLFAQCAPDDPLARLHQRRIADGATDTVIVLEGK